MGDEKRQWRVPQQIGDDTLSALNITRTIQLSESVKTRPYGGVRADIRRQERRAQLTAAGLEVIGTRESPVHRW